LQLDNDHDNEDVVDNEDDEDVVILGCSQMAVPFG
jgi:hypothetical protein